jgi:hypothetical protein
MHGGHGGVDKGQHLAERDERWSAVAGRTCGGPISHGEGSFSQAAACQRVETPDPSRERQQEAS